MFRYFRVGVLTVALLSILSGALTLALKQPVILPVLGWLRSLREEQLDWYISMWGRLLILGGLIFLVMATALIFLYRLATKRSAANRR